MASAAERTSKIRIGTGVTTPINRYHPAIVAQAFATLESMYPGRIFLGLGTGEAMNEVPVGRNWPPFQERAEKIEESMKIIRMLCKGGFNTFNGKHFNITDAHLYILPLQKFPIYIAASGPTMSEMAGRYADGLYTTPSKEEFYNDILFPNLRKGAQKVGRSEKDLDLMTLCNIAYDEDYDRAFNSIRMWKAVALGFHKPIWDPRKLDEMAEDVDMKDVTWRWKITTNLDETINWIESYIKRGFNEIEIRSASPDEMSFIKKFGSQVLSYLNDKYGR